MGATGGADTQPAPSPSSNTSPSMPVGAKRAFVTSTAYAGNLSAAVPGSGAVEGGAAGDALCQQVADAAELGGDYQAYLGDADTDPNTRLEGNGPWYSVKGIRLFNNKSNLATKPLAAFNMDERGETVASGNYNQPSTAWTGVGGDLCANWTTMIDEYSPPIVGLVGVQEQAWRMATGEQLSSASYGYVTKWSCASRAHLYCFEK